MGKDNAFGTFLESTWIQFEEKFNTSAKKKQKTKKKNQQGLVQVVSLAVKNKGGAIYYETKDGRKKLEVGI